MNLNQYIFREYDIRGKVSDDFPPDVVEALGKGFGTYMNTDYVVGHWHYSEIHFSLFDTTSGTDQT